MQATHVGRCRFECLQCGLCCVDVTGISNEGKRWRKWQENAQAARAACTEATSRTTLTTRMQEELRLLQDHLSQEPHRAFAARANLLEATVWKASDGEAGTARTTFTSALQRRTTTQGPVPETNYYQPSCKCGRPQVRPPTE